MTTGRLRSMRNAALIALLTIANLFAACSRQDQTKVKDAFAPATVAKNVASSDTVEAIEVTIAISIPANGMRGELSDRLKALIKKYDAETVMGMMSAGTTFLNLAGGEAIEMKDDWSTPVSFASAKIPTVKFRKGEVGIYKTEIFVKEGTEALVNDKAYVFTNKQWTTLGEAKQ